MESKNNWRNVRKKESFADHFPGKAGIIRLRVRESKTESNYWGNLKKKESFADHFPGKAGRK